MLRLRYVSPKVPADTFIYEFFFFPSADVFLSNAFFIPFYLFGPHFETLILPFFSFSPLSIRAAAE